VIIDNEPLENCLEVALITSAKYATSIFCECRIIGMIFKANCERNASYRKTSKYENQLNKDFKQDPELTSTILLC
jgi:hypothetical protein